MYYSVYLLKYHIYAAKTLVFHDCMSSLLCSPGELLFFSDTYPSQIWYCFHKCVCMCVLCDFVYMHMCICVLEALIHIPKSFPLFCQVRCQNLTRVATSLFSLGMSCSCSFLREDVQSKVNIWSESSLSKDSPGHMLSLYTGMQSEDLLYG